MGRRKIEIQPITTERNRSITFQKRKNGLFKKAYELGVLCSVDIAVVIFERGRSGEVKCYDYSSNDLPDTIMRRMSFQGPTETRYPKDFKDNKNLDGDDDDEEDDEAGSKKSTKAKPQVKAENNDKPSAPASQGHKPISSPEVTSPQPAPLSFPFSAERGPSAASASPQLPFTPDLETLRWLAGLQVQAQQVHNRHLSSPAPEPWHPSLPPSYSEVAGLSKMSNLALGSLQDPFASMFAPRPGDPPPMTPTNFAHTSQFAWPTHRAPEQAPNIGISKLSMARSAPEPDLSWLELLSSIPSSAPPMPPSIPSLPPQIPLMSPTIRHTPSASYVSHDGLAIPHIADPERAHKRPRSDTDSSTAR